MSMPDAKMRKIKKVGQMEKKARHVTEMTRKA
jgi:hypothetical protein